MSKFENDYKALLRDVFQNGILSSNRTGIDTIASFNKSMTIDLEQGFPILTGRKIFFDKAYHEYVWIVTGLTTLNYLHENGITWWDSYADKKGSLGKTYGYQLRSFNGEIDQLEYILNGLKLTPESRRLHITLWNPSELFETKIPPCYTGMTFMVQDGTLNMSVQLRSSDLMVGLPYDIIVMMLLLINTANFSELKIGKLGLQITNAHIYKNHEYQLQEYLLRDTHLLPTLHRELDGNFCLSHYKHEPHIIIPLNE
jgi:thymidylate synthase